MSLLMDKWLLFKMTLDLQEDSGSPLLLSPLSRFSPDRRSTMSQLRRRVQSLLRTESGRRTLARVHRRGTLPPQMAQMLEEMLREARDREGGGDEVDAGEGGEEEVQNMKEVRGREEQLNYHNGSWNCTYCTYSSITVELQYYVECI